MQSLLNFKKPFLKYFFLCLSLLIISSTSLFSKENALPPEDKIYQVGVIEDPPFVISKDGNWTGIAVDIWEMIAESLSIKFAYLPLKTTDPMIALQMLEAKECDILLASVGAILEQYRKGKIRSSVEYSRPYFVDTIGVLEEKSLPNFLITFFETLAASVGFWLSILSIIFAVYVLVLWFFEKESIFEMPTPQRPPENIWGVLKYAIWKQLARGHSGIPRTTWGKASLLGWLSSSYIIMLLLSSSVISFMTASIGDYRGNITNLDQLEKVEMISVKDQIQTLMVQEQGLRPKKVDTFDQGFEMLKKHQAKVMIDSGAHADYYLRETGSMTVHLIPFTLRYVLYSFAFSEENPLLSSVDQVLGDFHRAGSTQGVCKSYLSKMQMGCL